MNCVQLIGRLTSDPYYTEGTSPVAKMTIAVDRPPTKDGEKNADFPRVTAFGKTAEMARKYLTKGRKIAVVGRITTGSYEKNGVTIYTCDVIADRVEFLDSVKPQENKQGEQVEIAPEFEGFEQDQDIPF